MSCYRIGHGYDVHAFKQGDYLIIGGVRIPHNRSFMAHSDGDVLIHALCDALLGAMGLGDIGHHFPDTDSRYSGVDSRALLRTVFQLLVDKGWHVSNVDCTVVAQMPKLSPYLEKMRAHLAADLTIGQDQVNVKATTTERLGFAGREEGVEAHAVVLIEHP